MNKVNNVLINIFLKVNKLFPQKQHPFDILTDGVSNMNYTDFEYSHGESLINQYKAFIDTQELVGKKILEVGCGGGGKTIYIAQKYDSQCTGIDINLDFLDQAQSKASDLGVQKQVDFHEMSALDMTFADDTFDIIIMSDVLEHIPETKTFILEALRVLKPGGKILFDFAPYYHYFGHHIWDTIKIPWVHLITTEQLRIDLYKKSLENYPDKQKRLNLRLGINEKGKESFTYLNKISRKKFETIIDECEKMGSFQNCTINYFMLKNINIFGNIPILRELFIRHIVGVIKK